MNPATRLMVLLSLTLVSAYAGADDEFTRKFPLGSCRFLATGGNPYFPIFPGRQTYYSNSACVAAGHCDELTELWITMEHETKRISLPVGQRSRQVIARVMEERETEGGELVEVSRNFVADCFPSHDVYYFGEEVDIYEDGEIVSHEGAWLAGRNRAKPGILMPEDGFMVGSRYFQELAPDVALDRAEHKRAGFSVQVPAGKFDDCVEVEETTPLEPDAESTKVYCRGVGLVKDDELELTAVYGR
jgi:hypothetical protein